MKLEAVIFHTPNIAEIRSFYEEKLGLPTGTYLKDGKPVNDFSEDYVNYHIEGGLLCFEKEAERLDLGTVVIHTSDFSSLKEKLSSQGIEIIAGNEHWLKVKDPDGRSIIFEPAR